MSSSSLSRPKLHARLAALLAAAIATILVVEAFDRLARAGSGATWPVTMAAAAQLSVAMLLLWRRTRRYGCLLAAFAVLANLIVGPGAISPDPWTWALLLVPLLVVARLGQRRPAMWRRLATPTKAFLDTSLARSTGA